MNRKTTKILHVLDHSLPLQSGYTFRSQSIFKAQSDNGWQPVIVTSPKHEASWKGEWGKQETINGFTYYRSGATRFANVPLLGMLATVWRLYKRLLQVIQSEQPDIVHAHSPMLTALASLMAGTHMGVPVVYEIRAFWEDAAAEHGRYSNRHVKYKLVRAVETFVCRRAAHVFVICGGLKQDLVKRRIAENKISIVYNGVNTKEFSQCEPDLEYQHAWRLGGKTVLGFIGSFYAYEGLAFLVKAFAKFVQKRPNAVLLLVGGGPQDGVLRSLVKQLDIADNVVMPGREPHERIAGIYGLVDVLIYPRHSTRLTELVTPLKPLEAMAMRKPFLASDIGGHRELITDGKTGLLFESDNEQALLDGIEQLLSDAGLRERLSQQGCEWVRREHTWVKTTGIYREIYRQMLIQGAPNSPGGTESSSTTSRMP
jgi:PEP-CTERM/exosortase A-associated glycosyltransferase